MGKDHAPQRMSAAPASRHSGLFEYVVAVIKLDTVQLAARKSIGSSTSWLQFPLAEPGR